MALTPPVYLDNQSTTRVDPRVVAVMLPFFDRTYGNAGSLSHCFGDEARMAVESARQFIAQTLGAGDNDIVFTSGATESNNIALRGLADTPRRKGNHIVSVATEHRSVLDPLARLARQGVEVTLLTPRPHEDPLAGVVKAEQVAEALREDTLLVSVMLANNEIGAIHPLAEIGQICREQNIPLHCDATQAVGKLPVDVDALGIDLMSFAAHKMHGPKGVGGLYVRRRGKRIRLTPLFEGGGHEKGLRSGTLDVPGIVGMATALQLCEAEMETETLRQRQLRDRLAGGLLSEIPEARINGPALNGPARLAGNLNVGFRDVTGESLMLGMPALAVSSGSACTSAQPEPSHVLRALGLSDDWVRSSLRFGLSRFTTEAEIDFAVETVAAAVRRLRQLG